MITWRITKNENKEEKEITGKRRHQEGRGKEKGGKRKGQVRKVQKEKEKEGRTKNR